MDEKDLELGTELFLKRLEEIVDNEPEISDIHDAFEYYAAKKFSLGNSASNHRVGGKNDLGIDFYSQYEHTYQIGQCKIPDRDYLEANPLKPKIFGSSAVADARDALRYLTGKSDMVPNDRVRQLYALIEADRSHVDFSLTLFFVVYGRLNQRGLDAFKELKSEYESKSISIILQQVDDLVEEFLIGKDYSSSEITFDLRTNTKEILRAHNYCYFLASAADLYKAFVRFGWRLFDLNLRYEVRNSAINGEIVGSLKHRKSRKEFHHYNNGLTVIATSYSFHEKTGQVRLTQAQIVNGLQTVKSIYNAVSSKEVTLADIDEDCFVQVKVIRTSDAEFVKNVVKSTNNQNPMAARNLRSNNREQKVLRRGFALLGPRWFYQLKEGEWRSLTTESSRFFEQVVGYRPSEFRPDGARQAGRVIDNQDAAKAWLAFIGFSDQSGDRVTHFFSEDDVYELAFGSRPTQEYWIDFASATDWDKQRKTRLESVQGHASQYLFAYFLWQFVNGFVPSPQRYREMGLNEGHAAGRITKASGSFTSTTSEQDAYLSENRTYQTWRLMANMKELLVECASQILARRYGPLDDVVCTQLLNAFEAEAYMKTGEVREVAQRASAATDLKREEVFSRIFGMLHYVSGQFWEDRKQQLLSTSRLRTLLLKRDIAAEFKALVSRTEMRAGLDRCWKPEGETFRDSLPKVPLLRRSVTL